MLDSEFLDFKDELVPRTPSAPTAAVAVDIHDIRSLTATGPIPVTPAGPEPSTPPPSRRA